jgi:hypothetical protein
VGGSPVHLEAHREHALGLNAYAHVCGFAGDHEIPHESVPHQLIASSLGVLLGLLVGYDAESDPDLRAVAHVVNCEQHRRQRPLHVVCAAPEQALAVGARLELPRATRNHVEVAVQEHGGGARRPDLRDGHRQSPDVDLAGFDAPCLEPPLDESGGEAHPLRLGGVVGDQLFG